MGSTYKMQGDRLVPQLALPTEEEKESVGVWGQRHLRHLKEYRRITYADLLTSGMEKVSVKSIANQLGCSVQPLYSYCKNMVGLREEVGNKARDFFQEYIVSHIDKSDLFRSTGRAYIQLAKKEPHILKIFILQEREKVHVFYCPGGFSFEKMSAGPKLMMKMFQINFQKGASQNRSTELK